jgi:anti-sigma regulatory factor (Ser/Thr protein kinase)
MSAERPLSVVQQLPADEDAPRTAREVAAELLAKLRAGQARAEDLAIVVSELVSNAVVHAPGDNLTLRLVGTPSTIRVEVLDPGTAGFAWPEPQDEGGHWGLGLVRRFSERAGVTSEPSTCVWCEIDLDQPPYE